MARRYSRSSAEEKKNIKKAVTSIVAAVALLALLVFFGIPTIAKFAAFLSDLGKSDQPIEQNDNTPPPPPTLDDLPEYTSEQSIEVKGETESGALVTLIYNSKEEEVIADNDGDFSINIRLSKGQNLVYVFVKDPAGNESKQTKEHIVVYDKEPPDVNVSSPQDGEEFFGSRQRQVTIEGLTEENATIMIATPETSEGDERIVVVDTSGNFSFTTTLVDGDNTFTITAQDRAGNSSEVSLTLQFSP